MYIEYNYGCIWFWLMRREVSGPEMAGVFKRFKWKEKLRTEDTFLRMLRTTIQNLSCYTRMVA